MKKLYITLIVTAAMGLIACSKDKGGSGVPPVTQNTICNQLRVDTDFSNNNHNGFINNQHNYYIDQAGNQYVRQNNHDFRNLRTDEVINCPNIKLDNTVSNNCLEAINNGGYPVPGGWVQWQNQRIFCGNIGYITCNPSTDINCPNQGGTISQDFFHNIPSQFIPIYLPSGGFRWGIQLNFGSYYHY